MQEWKTSGRGHGYKEYYYSYSSHIIIASYAHILNDHAIINYHTTREYCIVGIDMKS